MSIKFLFLAETRSLADQLAVEEMPVAWPVPDEIYSRSYGCPVVGHRFDRVFLALPSPKWLESSGDALRFAHFLAQAKTYVKPHGQLHII